MKFWIISLKVFGYLWLAGAVLLIMFGIYGIWLEGGFSLVREIMSPFNITNFIVTVITLAPGLGAIALSNKLKSKSGATSL